MRGLIEKYIDEPAQADWTDFWITLTNLFVYRYAEGRARSQLIQLMQSSKTAYEFFLEFFLLAMKAGIDMAKPEQFLYLQSIINRYMNSNLIDRLHMTEPPTTMEEYIRKLESLDAFWRMFEEERRIRRNAEGNASPRRRKDIPRAKDHATENVPVDVDRNRTRTRANWTAEQTKLAREGRCFLFKERGHRRRDCSRRTATTPPASG